MSKNREKPVLYTYPEAAARLGVCVRTVQRMASRGELRRVYRGLRAFVLVRQVEKLRTKR